MSSPLGRVMNPYPLAALNHFIIPVSRLISLGLLELIFHNCSAFVAQAVRVDYKCISKRNVKNEIATIPFVPLRMAAGSTLSGRAGMCLEPTVSHSERTRSYLLKLCALYYKTITC